MAAGIEIKEVAPDGAVHLIETIASGPSPIEKGSEALCALFLIAMIVLIGSEAIARNVFATSLQVTDEIGGYLLVAMTFLSMSVAEAHGAFHRVELIQARLGVKVRMISPKTWRRPPCRRRCGCPRASWPSAWRCSALPWSGQLSSRPSACAEAPDHESRH